MFPNAIERNLVPNRVLIVNHCLRISRRHVQEKNVPHSGGEEYRIWENFTRNLLAQTPSRPFPGEHEQVRATPAQLPPARLHRPASQRLLRRRLRRNPPSRATRTSRRSRLAATAYRHLLRPRRQGERPLFRPQTRRRKAVECEPHRRLKLWIYDVRANKHFTLKENPLKRSDLDDFVAFNPKELCERKESDPFKRFSSRRAP